MDRPFVSVIVVNYNGRRWLDGCMDSVFAQDYPRHRYEVLLVDNGSTDGSLEHLATHWPAVRVIRAGANLGFARANNVAIRLSRGAWVALLNNDAEAEPGWLRELVTVGERDSRLGGVAGEMRYLHDPATLNSTGLVLLRDGRGADRDLDRAADGERTSEPVFGGCGASLLLRRAMLDDLGGFDERLFMYYEDLDLAWRARSRGWRFRTAPRSIIRHAGSGTAGLASPFQWRHVERNRVRVSVRNAPPFVAVLAAVGHPLRLVRQVTRGPLREMPRLLRLGLEVVASLPGWWLERWAERGRVGRWSDHALARWMHRPASLVGSGIGPLAFATGERVRVRGA